VAKRRNTHTGRSGSKHHTSFVKRDGRVIQLAHAHECCCVPAAMVQRALWDLSALRVRMHTHTLFNSAPCSADTVDTWEAQSASTRSHHFCWNRAEVRRQAAVSNSGPSSASASTHHKQAGTTHQGTIPLCWRRVWVCTCVSASKCREGWEWGRVGGTWKRYARHTLRH
jgi:hypothetical protein